MVRINAVIRLERRVSAYWHRFLSSVRTFYDLFIAYFFMNMKGNI